MELLIDLRSDTVTKPSPGMRNAMAQAEVGDDVLGEDPTINELERRVASLLGKEAALFVPSGTMANQIAVRCHTEPGDEVILEVTGHSYAYEGGGMSAISGVQPRTLVADRGILDPEAVEAAVMPNNVHFGRSRLVMVENTSNRGGGTIYTPERVRAIAEVARRHGMKLHMDGARLWNAHVASKRPLVDFTDPVDSVSVCLSKGLGAPAGSVLAGPQPFVDRSRRARKMLGGGMRQAGILAAAGLYALENNLERLVEDHRKLAALILGLSEIPGIEVPRGDRFPTNIAYVRTPGLEARALVARLRSRGVLVNATGKEETRLVTHLDLDVDAIPRTIEAFRAALTRP